MSAGRPIGEDDLHGHVDGALDAARSREVEAYLAAHPDVAARVEAYAVQRHGMRVALAPVAAELVPADLNLATLIAARRRSRGVPWRGAVAAVLCLAIGGGGGWIVRGLAGTGLAGPAPTDLAALAREAAASYEVFAPDKARPVEIQAADEDQLVRWVSNRLHRPVRVPDLAGAGYRFIGGRLVATAHGPAGLYMYDDAVGGRLAIMVRPIAAEPNGAMLSQTNGTVSGFAWAEDQLGYSLVAFAPAKTLHPLADEVRRQMGGPA